MKRKQLTPNDLPTPQQLVELIEAIPSKYGVKGQRNVIQYQAFIAFLYLTGARVSEVVGGRTIIEVEDRQPFKTRVDAIKKENIEYVSEEGTSFALIHGVINLKRRNKTLRRTIVINTTGDSILWGYVEKWLVDLAPTRELFPMLRNSAWRIVKRTTGKYPHLLRHARLTYLVREKRLLPHELQQFTGWASSRMGEIYLHSSPRDLMRKLI